jgi:hypothetical protein
MRVQTPSASVRRLNSQSRTHIAHSTGTQPRDLILNSTLTAIAQSTDEYHDAQIGDLAAGMARISKASTMNDSSPGVPSRRYTSQPSVTKEDIQKVKEEIVLAEKMVKIAVKTHEHKTLEHEQVILKKIRESREFQTKVKAFRRELVSQSERSNVLESY